VEISCLRWTGSPDDWAIGIYKPAPSSTAKTSSPGLPVRSPARG